MGVVTDGRWDSMELLRDSWNRHTKTPQEYEVILVDNANFDKKSMRDWVPLFKSKECKLIVQETRRACAHNWNRIVKEAKHDWVVIVNDDSVFCHDHWDVILQNRIKEKPGFKFFALCQPNSFSGFAVHKKFWWDMGGMREEYVTAGLEDEDFWLECQRRLGYTNGVQLLQSVFYSFPRHEKKPLMAHKPLIHSPLRRAYWGVEKKNKPIFEKYWRALTADEWMKIKDSKTTAESFGSILEGKAGRRYVYIGPEDKK